VPLYEYQCPKCGRFELIQKFSDAPLSACPTCGREVQKLLSAPAIQFKGSGWYITDYARKSSGGDSAKGEAAKTSEAKAGEGGGKSDSGSSTATTSKDGSASTKSSGSTAK
jgi:putative FmdB family regulatory protein